MAFLVRRLLLTLPILFIVSVICFSMITLIPGDPATVILGPEATEQAKEQMRNRLNLNDPLPVQYLDWLGGVLRGDQILLFWAHELQARTHRTRGLGLHWWLEQRHRLQHFLLRGSDYGFHGRSCQTYALPVRPGWRDAG